MKTVDFSTPTYTVQRTSRFTGTGYVHYRCEPASRGGVTLYYSRAHLEYIRVGVAVCSPRDNFSRARGRKIAEGRIQTHPQYAHLIGNDSEQRIWQELDELAWNAWANAHVHRLRHGIPPLFHFRLGQRVTIDGGVF